MSKHYEGYFTRIIDCIVLTCQKSRAEGDVGKISYIVMTFSSCYSKSSTFTQMSKAIVKNAQANPVFYSSLVEALAEILTREPEMFDLRSQLADQTQEEGRVLFELLFPSFCYSSTAAILLCFMSQKYELAWRLINKFALMKTPKNIETFIRLKSLAEKLELSQFMYIRLQMLNPEKNYYLIKSLQALLMILPQEEAFYAIYNRLKCLNVPSLMIEKSVQPKEEDPKTMEEWISIFDKAATIF